MLRRIAPAIGLFFLSPFVGEFLLGNVALDALPIGLIMAPMYGGGAVLIREVARRANRGWPTIILLAIAYGAIEEGLACQTLFNPSYFGFSLLHEGYIRPLGMGAWWTLFVLTLHTVWSISVPIAIIESLVPARDRPLARQTWTGVCVVPLRARLRPRFLGHVSARTVHRHTTPIDRSRRFRRCSDSRRVFGSATKPSE